MGRLVRPLRRHGAGRRSARSRWRSATWPPASATSLWQFALAQGLLIGCSAARRPSRRCSPTSRCGSRADAASRSAIFASGNYLAGAVWPPVVQHFIETAGWRATYFGIGVFCVVTMLPLALLLRRPPPAIATRAGGRARRRRQPRAAARPVAGALQGLLIVAGRRLLRRDVDAAGPHRRLLRRPRLRRRARRGDAVADARLRHRQPARVRAGSPTASAGCARCCSARRCRASRCCCSCRSTGSCRCT